MKRRRATSYELVFKAMEFQAILKRGGGGRNWARKSVNGKLPLYSSFATKITIKDIEIFIRL